MAQAYLSRHWFPVCIGLAFGLVVVVGLRGREAAPLPDVAAGNAWGQHTPRSPGSIVSGLSASLGEKGLDSGVHNPIQLRPGARTAVNPQPRVPRVHESAWIDARASVVGDVEISPGVLLAPFVSIRNEGSDPVHLDAGVSLQAAAVIEATATGMGHGYEIAGRRYSVYLGPRVSLGNQAQVHGPAWLEADVYVGMQALVFRAHIGREVVIEPAARVIGVKVPAGRYVPSGSVVATQYEADRLPEISPDYPLAAINRAVVRLNRALVESHFAPSPAASSPSGWSRP